MSLSKRPNFSEYESEVYQKWENAGVFTPKIDPTKKPFTILLPPPNANAPLHVGHALYVIEDIMCRYHRMLGDPTLFLPGTDHAGIETQFVFEKHLAEKKQSRFDFDRETLYRMIYDFVEENRGIATNQLRKLGFSLDWTRETYTMDAKILTTVLETFRQMHDDGLLYRDERLVNYCTNCGTGFSNLEVEYVDRQDSLYYLKYGPFTLATTRPETKFGDTAVAVHPNDPRYQDLIGTEFVYDSLIGPRRMKVIADELVDPEFGTGAVKVTPAHDPNDFEMGQRHHLEAIQVIGRDGKMTEVTGRFAGMTIHDAREQVVKELQAKGEMVKIDDQYAHRVGVCYRCKHTIEPMLVPQWYVKTKTLTANVIKALESKETQIFPKRFEKDLRRWLETAPDWNISRQIVWGPRIPIWYDLDQNPNIELTFLDKNGQTVIGKYADLKDQHEFAEIEKGLQTLIAPVGSSYQLSSEPEPGSDGRLLQETDTFDTWFSSGQWPLTTLGFPDSDDFKYFYPTSILDTMWDILPFWVMRMLMLGIYRTGKAPFAWSHMHARVVDGKGQKMSKSKGNVVNPMETVEQYGADTLRLALVFGVAPAADVAIGDEKLIGMRNFITKLWNISRFIEGQTSFNEYQYGQMPNLTEADRAIVEKLNQVIKEVNKNMEKFRFAQVIEDIYEFVWHEFADVYVEQTKERLFDKDKEEKTPQAEKEAALWTLVTILTASLKLLHPFIPFVTEEIYQNLELGQEFLATSKWPEPVKL